MTSPSRPFTWPYVPRLDRAYKVLGVFANGRTTWTLPSTDPLVNRIVLGDGFGDMAGAVLVPVTINGNRVQVVGNFTDDYCMIGREFASEATLNKPIPRSMNGTAVNRGVVMTREVVTRHFNSAGYSVVAEWTGPGSVNDRTKRFRGRLNSDNLTELAYDGVLTARHNGRSEFMDIRIENNDTRPHTIVAAEVLYDFVPRR
jgi:hypothetical protein